MAAISDNSGLAYLFQDEPTGPWLPDFSPERAKKYERVKKIGQGAFGEVVLSRDSNGNLVACKSVRVATGGSVGAYGQRLGSSSEEPELPKPIFRELTALRHLSGHPNIIELVDAFPSGSDITMVLEFAPSDLEVVIGRANSPLPETHVKSLIQMLLRGLAHMHENGILVSHY